MRATGAELMAFYEAWPIGQDFYHDDGYETDDQGKLNLDPAEKYDVEEAIGYLCWQGKGGQPQSIEVNGSTVHIPNDWNGPSSVDVFKAWRGDKRAHIVMLDPDQVDTFKTICAEHGWETA